MLSQEVKIKYSELSNPITAIENISYFIFMKRLEKFYPKVDKKFKWGLYNSLRGNDLKQ